VPTANLHELQWFFASQSSYFHQDFADGDWIPKLINELQSRSPVLDAWSQISVRKCSDKWA